MNRLQKIWNFLTKSEEISELEQLIAHVKNPAHRAIYKVIVQNQLDYRDNDAVASGQKCPHCNKLVPKKTDTTQLLPKIAVKVLDQIIILDNFIGIQPMQGPVGLIYKLRYKRTDQEEGEGKGARLTLEICSEAIEAKSRKLAVSWSIEASQDLQQQHGVNIEEEVIQAVAIEMASEIIDEMLSKMTSEAKLVKLETFFSGSELTCHINQAASEIARLTRRGAGNFIIVDPVTLSVLQGDKNTPFIKVDDETAEQQKSFRLKRVGTLCDSIHVYCDLLATKSIVGYKGSSGETDAGLFYSPYVLLMSTGIVMNPTTFQPQVSFITRYGDQLNENGGDYFYTLDVQFSSEKEIQEKAV